MKEPNKKYTYKCTDIRIDLDTLLEKMHDKLKEAAPERNKSKESSIKPIIVVLGETKSKERCIINLVDELAVDYICKLYGKKIFIKHIPQDELSRILIYNLALKTKKKLILETEVDSSMGSRHYPTLYPISFSINSTEAKSIINILSKMRLLKVSNPKIKWLSK